MEKRKDKNQQLKASAEEYIDHIYNYTLKKFLKFNEGSEAIYIEDEINVFRASLYAVDNYEKIAANYYFESHNWFLDYIYEVGKESFRYTTLKKIEFLEAKLNGLKIHSKDLKYEKQDINVIVKEEYVSDVYATLKDYFSSHQQKALLLLLESGKNNSDPLVFKGNSIQIVTAFQELLSNNILTIKKKTDLSRWIAANFLYVKDSDILPIKTETVYDYLKPEKTCRHPILYVCLHSSIPTVQDHPC